MDTVPYLLDGPVGGWPPPSTDSGEAVNFSVSMEEKSFW